MKRLLIAVSLLVVLVAAVLIGVSVWVSRTVSAEHQHGKSDQLITIDKGSTPRQVVGKLADEGIIPSYLAALIYIRTAGDGSKLQAGDYQFPSPISTLQALAIVEKGEVLTIKITIPEGFTRFDIAKRIAEKFPQEPPANDKSVLALMDDVTQIKDIAPTATNLEGYMYPTTYNFPKQTPPKKIIHDMVEEFRKMWKPEWTAAAQAEGRTIHQIVTIASLIETETAVPSERPIVAGVVNNRLSKNIPLGIDQTNVYIAKMLGRWDGEINKSDLEVDSPYNTRIKTGLPPGPISSVTASSITAALFPDHNDYLYYVRNVDLNDGSHWFYASAADFEKGKVKYQQYLEQQRAEKRAEQTTQQPQ